MKNKYFLIVTLGIIALGVFGYYFYSIQKPLKIKMTERKNLAYPIWVGEDKELFKKENIQIENVKEPQDVVVSKDWETTGKELRKWFNEGNADMTILSTDELFNMEIEYPGSVKAIAFFSDSDTNYATNFVVGKNSNINSAEDLKGKKIMADTADIDQFLLEDYMHSAGDFTPLKVPKSLWADFLNKGTADAVWATEPQTTMLLENESAKLLLKNPNNASKEFRGAITGAIVLRTGFINKNKGGVKRLVKLLNQVNNGDEVRDSVKKHAKGISGEVVAKRTFCLFQVSKDVNRELFQRLSDEMFENRYISKKVDTSKLIY